MAEFDDKTLDFLESQIPAFAAAAVLIARHEILAAGVSVVQLEGEWIVEQFSDGTKRQIKRIEPDLPVETPKQAVLQP